MQKFTISQFKNLYPDDATCLQKIYDLRYTGLVCPKCNNEKPFTPVKNKRSYQCSACGFQLYPTAGTIFEKTTTSLTDWFLIIYMQTTTRNGVSAKEVERTLDVCYKTALRMCHQIKKLMEDKSPDKLNGIVEVDEMYIGMSPENKHASVRKAIMRDKDHKVKHTKTPVIGFLERDGEVRMRVMDTDLTFKEHVRPNVDPSATLITDTSSGYKGLKKEYNQHETLNHSMMEYVREGYHINNIEGVWSMVRRTIYGTHVHVSTRHLPKYLNEIAFRYKHRNNQAMMFEKALRQVV